MKTLIVLFVIACLGVIGLYIRKRNFQKTKPEFSAEEYEQYYELKKGALEQILGPMHDMVGHSIIPFQAGGFVDMYFFPNSIPGTGFATMELIKPDGSGPKPNRIGTYELVAFTNHRILSSYEKSQNQITESPQDPYTKIKNRFCGIFTQIGFYSYEAVLNPGETCELPQGENEPTICLILDEYSPNGKHFKINGKQHCLLICIEVFRSEMEYARKNGSAAVLKKLKEAGYYPYSDLDRKPVF